MRGGIAALIAISILMSIIISGCQVNPPLCQEPMTYLGGTCCQDRDNNQICDSDNDNITEKQSEHLDSEFNISENFSGNNTEKNTVKPLHELPDRTFGLEDLSGEISRITDKKEFLREEERNLTYVELLKSQDRKIYTTNLMYISRTIR